MMMPGNVLIGVSELGMEKDLHTFMSIFVEK